MAVTDTCHATSRSVKLCLRPAVKTGVDASKSAHKAIAGNQRPSSAPTYTPTFDLAALRSHAANQLISEICKAAWRNAIVIESIWMQARYQIEPTFLDFHQLSAREGAA